MHLDARQRLILRQAATYPAFAISQLGRDLAHSSAQLRPTLDALARRGLVKRLDAVYGPKGWERAWAVTRAGRKVLP